MLSLILANQEGEAISRGLVSLILNKAVVSRIHPIFCIEHVPAWGKQSAPCPLPIHCPPLSLCGVLTGRGKSSFLLSPPRTAFAPVWPSDAAQTPLVTVETLFVNSEGPVPSSGADWGSTLLRSLH